ncbi:MAG: CopG family ribbon-helix-helix protein [Vicinamibacterales bacterium]
MKTIAITIDEDMLNRLDRLLDRGSGGAARRSRSRLIREAVNEYLLRHERQAAEEREAAIISRHRVRLVQQARAAIREQAKP